MSIRVQFCDMLLLLPDGWVDITDDLGPGAVPTLARGEAGFGVLQFTSAFYTAGVDPTVTTAHLVELLDGLQRARGLLPDGSPIVEDLPRPSVRADFSMGSDFVRVYYVSEGSNICLVTYVSEAGSPKLESELVDADAIVSSLTFEPEA